jgi:NADH-quinone oxidoreductase subunit C
MIPARRDVSASLPPALEEKLPGAVAEVLTSRGELYLRVEAASLVEVCRFLREEPEWNFDFLALVSAVDWLGKTPRFEVVYHLRSLANNTRVGLKAAVPDETLTVPSVTNVWKSADWLEREVYDLYGITFAGHPDLRRIMMPDDWEGHPYRKDFPLEGRQEP